MTKLETIRRGQRIAQAASAMIVLLAVATPANAIERFRSDQINCAAVQQTLDKAGKAVIRHPSKRVDNYLLFGHYVASGEYCEPQMHAVKANVISADDPACLVHRCKRNPSGGGTANANDDGSRGGGSGGGIHEDPYYGQQ